jgi:hypothetical protein
MANPLVAKIGQASKDAWPQVSAGVAQTMRSLNELAGISEDVVPKVEEYVARGNTASIRRRKVCEETIWVLASLGWLRTGGERDVVLAAKAWFDATEDPNASDDEIVVTEDQLADAIKSLPEYLTTPQES